MISFEKQGVLTLVKSAIMGEELSLPEETNIDYALQIAKKHNIAALIYYGAFNCGIDKDLPPMKELFLAVYKNIVMSETQIFEIDKLKKAFDNNAIDYMLLKGSLLKQIYPKAEMRRMGDVDILIKEEQYENIKKLLENEGYTFKYETDHEIVWCKKTIYLELHKKLIPERNREFYAYFGSGWQFAKKKNEETFAYQLSKEDTFIYLFAHLAKHYTGGGIGIQHMLDLWVYKLANPDLNEALIVKQLKKLYLDKFYLNVMQTLESWFCAKQGDDITDFITEFIFASGTYGEHTNRILAVAARQKRYNGKTSKFRKIMSLLFPSVSALKIPYPVLKEKPFLLPFIWIRRWFEVLFFKSKKITRRINELENSTDKNIDKYQEALNFVGLDFNFKE